MFSFISHHNETTVYPPGGPSQPNDLKSTNLVNLSVSFPDTLREKSRFVWAGYKYTILKISVASPAMSAINLPYDLPGIDLQDTASEPIFSIQIQAINQGLAVTKGDPNEVLPSASPINLTISIPVYIDSVNVPVLTDLPTGFTDHLSSIIEGDGDKLLELPMGLLQTVFGFTVSVQGVLHGAFMPSKGVLVPKTAFPNMKTGSFMKDSSVLVTRLNTNNGYADGKLVIPGANGGVSQMMALSTTEFTGKKSLKMEDEGIPVVVSDKDGNSVEIPISSQLGDESSTPFQIRLLGFMSIVLSVLVFVAIGGFIPSPEMTSMTGGLFVLGIVGGLIPMILSISTISSKTSSLFDNSTLYSALMIILMISSIVLILTIVGFTFVGQFDDILQISISSLVFMILSIIGIMTTVLGATTTDADYQSQFRSTPPFFSTLVSSFKYIFPISLMALFGIPSNLLNFFFMNSVGTRGTASASLMTSEKINSIFKTAFTQTDETGSKYVTQTQGSSLKNVMKSIFKKGTNVFFLDKNGKERALKKSGEFPEIDLTIENPTESIQEQMILTKDITSLNGVLLASIAIFAFVSFSIPGLFGPNGLIAKRSLGTNKEPTLTEKLMDGAFSIGSPLVFMLILYISGIQHTFNAGYLTLMGATISAMIINLIGMVN